MDSWGQDWSQWDQGTAGTVILMRYGDNWNQGRGGGGGEEGAVLEDTGSGSLSGVLSFSSFTSFCHRKIILEKFKGPSF